MVESFSGILRRQKQSNEGEKYGDFPFDGNDFKKYKFLNNFLPPELDLFHELAGKPESYNLCFGAKFIFL